MGDDWQRWSSLCTQTSMRCTWTVHGLLLVCVLLTWIPSSTAAPSRLTQLNLAARAVSSCMQHAQHALSEHPAPYKSAHVHHSRAFLSLWTVAACLLMLCCLHHIQSRSVTSKESLHSWLLIPLPCSCRSSCSSLGQLYARYSSLLTQLLDPMLQDLAYIDWLVSLHPGVYRKRTPQRKQNATDYDGLWEGLQPERFYVKVGFLEQAHGLHGMPIT